MKVGKVTIMVPSGGYGEFMLYATNMPLKNINISYATSAYQYLHMLKTEIDNYEEERLKQAKEFGELDS